MDPPDTSGTSGQELRNARTIDHLFVGRQITWRSPAIALTIGWICCEDHAHGFWSHSYVRMRVESVRLSRVISPVFPYEPYPMSGIHSIGCAVFMKTSTRTPRCTVVVQLLFIPSAAHARDGMCRRVFFSRSSTSCMFRLDPSTSGLPWMGFVEVCSWYRSIFSLFYSRGFGRKPMDLRSCFVPYSACIVPLFRGKSCVGCRGGLHVLSWSQKWCGCLVAMVSHVQSDRNRWPLCSSFILCSMVVQCISIKAWFPSFPLHRMCPIFLLVNMDPVSMGFFPRVHSFPSPQRVFSPQGDPTCVPTGWEAHPHTHTRRWWWGGSVLFPPPPMAWDVCHVAWCPPPPPGSSHCHPLDGQMDREGMSEGGEQGCLPSVPSDLWDGVVLAGGGGQLERRLDPGRDLHFTVG